MRVAEIYKSIQGEGFLAGTESVFVRTSGCNLRCGYCDTPYASWRPEGDDLSVDAVIQQVIDLACGHVVITGGEPLLFSELIPLCASLSKAAQHITIETAGTLYLPLACDLMSISPKLSNSTPSLTRAPRWRARHERTRHMPHVIRQLVQEYRYQFKFVVGNLADCDEAQRYLSDFPEIDSSHVMLMPEGTDADALVKAAQWLEPLCAERNLRYCPRRHIELFGLVRGT